MARLERAKFEALTQTKSEETKTEENFSAPGKLLMKDIESKNSRMEKLDFVINPPSKSFSGLLSYPRKDPESWK
jgi:hypothetical protein